MNASAKSRTVESACATKAAIINLTRDGITTSMSGKMIILGSYTPPLIADDKLSNHLKTRILLAT
jgi:hypothetical protein